MQFFTGMDPASHIRIPGLEYASTVETFTQERWGFRRVAATSTHPIELGVILGTVFPLAVHRALAAAGSAPRRWWAVAVIAAAVPMTGSRSAFIALAVASLVLLIGFTPVQRRRAVLAVTGYLVIMKVLVPGLIGTMRSIFLSSSSDPSVQGRTEDYAAIGGLLDGHLFTGRGLGTFIPETYFILDNQYLGTLVETRDHRDGDLIVLFLVGMGTADSARQRARHRVDPCWAWPSPPPLLASPSPSSTFDALGYPMASGMTFLLLGLAGASLRFALDEQRSTCAGPAEAEAGVPA